MYLNFAVGTDYYIVTSQLTSVAGANSVLFTVWIIDDKVEEQNEDFELTINRSSILPLSVVNDIFRPTTIVSIRDDDGKTQSTNMDTHI